MTAKEYLSQAYHIDRLISSKIEQVRSLRELALQATVTSSETLTDKTRNVRRMEDVIVKIVDLESEINEDIDRLVDLKREILAMIKSVDNPEYQALLDLRYLGQKTWEDIADAFSCDIRHVYRLHSAALKLIKESFDER